MPRHVKSALVLVTGFALATAAGAFAESHVRIVRLSYVNGQVQTDRATGQGLERAILNTPIVQGTRIVTGNDGLAEVEFENASTLRIAEDSDVDFRTLSMSDTGAKVNEIEVVKGLVYLDARSKNDTYRLKSGDSTFLVQHDAQLRLSVNPDQTRLSVFKGNAQLMDQPQMVNVKRKETLTVDQATPSEYKIASGAEPVSTDAWNREREAYQEAYANNAGNPGPKSGYGLQDLNYYGNYFMAPGYGYAWQPYGFASSMFGFDPYNSGAWVFSPGLGYSFASPYPWGWLPYHYGAWAFLDGIGWAWLPGGNYRGGWYNSQFQAAPVVAKAPPGWTAATPPVVAAAQSPKPTVMVSKSTSAASAGYIAGGRIPPAFSSVIRGRSVGASATGESFKPATVHNLAVNDHVFTTRYNAFGGHTAQSGHVFAVPAPAATFASPMAVGPTFGSSTGRGIGPTAMSGPHATVAGHSSSGGSHH
ncbi:MAG: FecR family protein [Candidatus Korobacteraceae bacterium]